MNALVNDLLDLAKIEVGRFAVAPERCSASQLVKEACELMQTLAQSKNIAIVLEHPADMSVRADPARIFQILFNLIGNAINMPRKGARSSWG